MKGQLKELYTKVKDHPYWDKQTQENWDDIRPFIIRIENCIASYEFWRDRRWYDHHVETDVYKTEYSPYFTKYCHDVRKYCSFRKCYDKPQDELKRRNWLWEYVQFVECFANDKFPFVDSGRCKKTVRYFDKGDLGKFWYPIEIWKEEDRQYLIDLHKKWTTCKSEYLVEWASHIIEMLENKTIKIYEFE